ncbi:MAG: hypothetical protein M1143_00245 [Candidatus Thermoplasmatota archaeon]|nr:hypothetical protein [Candidatus Thermoplasmatota archaeon]
MSFLNLLFSPPTGLSLWEILGLALVLGILHGGTPDEHTWPITFSYSVGSYSTKGGMRAGFVFSTGFTIQRAILTTLGFLGLASIYLVYNLDGPVYVLVGVVMFMAGSYILKGRYLHLPFDVLFGGKGHHTDEAQRLPTEEVHPRPTSLRMALGHGFVAGWGFGGFATILVFFLAPQVGSVFLAPLVGLMFGIGTMLMQILTGAIFANLIRRGRMTLEQVKFIGQKTAGRTLYWGGLAFAVLGAVIILLPQIDAVGISTGNPVPNLDFLGIAFIMVVFVVGFIGGTSIFRAFREAKTLSDGSLAKEATPPAP